MGASVEFRNDANIKWYRCHVDKELMNELMQRSDWQGFRQAVGHLGLLTLTGGLSYFVFSLLNPSTWAWAAPLLLATLFAHGTVASFIGGHAVHELCHKTPFRSAFWNDFFLKVYAFIGWSDYLGFRRSHIKHHQFTVHRCCDGEVVLPLKYPLSDWQFWLRLVAWHPMDTYNLWKTFYRRARGHVDGDWLQYVLPEENATLRRQHRNWARLVLIGHGVLATTFILSGHWFMIVVFTLCSQYCHWLSFLTGAPQHFGLSPDVPDFRLCCRTYTCSRLVAFLYWNMQYHIEHHMFPAVPFFNLPKLHKLIEHELPPTPHGLWQTWRELLAIYRKQKVDPNYCYVPPLRSSSTPGEEQLAHHAQLEREAALALEVSRF